MMDIKDINAIAVHRRTGGLEIFRKNAARQAVVHRRTGGLEIGLP